MTLQVPRGIVSVVAKIIQQRPGELVRQRREAMGLSLERFAVRADVSSATIGRLERADALPKHEIVLRIAAVLGISASDIYAAAERAAS